MTNATSAARTPAFPSKQLPNVGTTIFTTVMSALATEHNAVNLGKAPDFECAPELVDAVTQAMKAGHNQYPPMPGVPALREAVARKIEARCTAAPTTPARKSPSPPGATQAIITAILAIVHRATR